MPWQQACFRRFRLLIFVGLTLASVSLPASAQQGATKLKVVATFSILGDFARNVGGDGVDVTTLVGPNGDVHVYTPPTADAEAIRSARLVIVNGLGLEGWLPRLVESSGSTATTFVAAHGIMLRKVAAGEILSRDRGAGAVDPHAWQSVANAEIYITNIRDAMIAANPANAATYRANASAYLTKLEALDHEVREALAPIPQERRKVISTHDAFGYFAAAYDLTFVAPEGVSTETEPSARDIATIITQIKKEKIPAVFLENVSDPRLMRQIASETGAAIGGTLYSDSLTSENGEAPNYIEMVRHNIRTIASALGN
ncbi:MULTISPECIES: metal ABC transporter substrate-binding protein [unclassified Bradyrhizobium]|uniref:metal ABC transporter substrate-binding protein n=1 Tax=unclassified Bradyrhizobium TaxID=2631580 RepID=UPI00102A5427|nr:MULTISPECIES: metal ABC transporter substrate-binding protein [unclassified Bradyrhizobium]RZN13632.1 ABC transporter substrate-binding protein [Bradyrhizobium sp. Leo121]TAI63275.1 ABC transporter substrate-binding protein [Bradyrhizobium sp. Leo170]